MARAAVALAVTKMEGDGAEDGANSAYATGGLILDGVDYGEVREPLDLTLAAFDTCTHEARSRACPLCSSSASSQDA